MTTQPWGWNGGTHPGRVRPMKGQVRRTCGFGSVMLLERHARGVPGFEDIDARPCWSTSFKGLYIHENDDESLNDEYVSGPTDARPDMTKREGWEPYGVDGDRWVRRFASGWILTVEATRHRTAEWRVYIRGDMASDGIAYGPFPVYQAMCAAEEAATRGAQ